ncbi:MAG: M28 family peptidase [Flavobacteriales bacterium]|nr:MAG: M28 family peptidase [Flavobacteriales bacterium]
MKKFGPLLLTMLILGCGATQTNKNSNPIGTTAADGMKGSVAAVEESTKDDIAAKNKIKGEPKSLTFSSSGEIAVIMDFLASDLLQGRDAGRLGIGMAADFIENIFMKNGVKPYFETYRDTLSNFEKPAFNMVGVVEGNDPSLKDEFIILGAHYDHIGLIDPENNDSIANGANDNASGSTVVLELARYFGNTNKNKRTIVFTLFSAEEKGLLGSEHLAQKLKAQNMDLYAMLNFEMVGVPLIDKDYLMYLTGYELSNLASVSNTYAKENLAGFLPKAQEFNLFKRSDNYPFHNVFGVPSQTYSTFDFTNFDFYHRVDDEASLMDFGHMANLVNKVIPVIEGIVNAPTREIKYN